MEENAVNPAYGEAGGRGSTSSQTDAAGDDLVVTVPREQRPPLPKRDGRDETIPPFAC
jgi:hypothetical protein